MSTNEHEVIEELKNIGCCDCCVLRYLNINNEAQLRNPETILSKLSIEKINGCPEAKTKKANPCSSCLGLLQDCQTYNQLDKVIKDVEEASYDSSEVTFALSLPISLQLRNYSIWLHMRDKFYSYFLEKQKAYDIFEPTIELKADTNVTSLKEAWKTLCGPVLGERLKKDHKDGTDSQFIVNVHFQYPDDEQETACIALMHPETFAERKQQKRKYHNEVLTRKSVEIALDKTSRDLFETHSRIPPGVPSSYAACSHVVCTHESLYIAGRYNKYSRSLSQTPWLINGERRMESSVEEIIRHPIAGIVPHDVIKFSSSGREDVDVRMLGRGRPFVLDIQNPRRTRLSFSELRQLEQQINSSTTDIFVRDLQIVRKDELTYIKCGEQTKTKTYNCFCVALKNFDNEVTVQNNLEALNALKPFVIQQRTPMRVLHRRPLAVRPRTVHWIRASFSHADSNHIFFNLSLKVEAGTYIKELVHGDLGRTSPNLSSMLGVDADILALDVDEIDLEWPPSVNLDKENSEK